MKKALIIALLVTAIVGLRAGGLVSGAAVDPTSREPEIRSDLQAQQTVFVIPVSPVVVAPGQPAVGSADAATPNSQGVKTASPTAGIINALCSVTLNIVNCGFVPNSVTLSCDGNDDGVPELSIPLQGITPVSRLLVRATLAPDSETRGSPFPLSCCGGVATLTMIRSVGAGDDNVFGPFTRKLTTEIDLGLRAPVVLSVTPSSGDCGTSQNLLIPGACFIRPDGTPNATSVFAVDSSDPGKVIQATRFVILNANLIDADFSFGSASAGKSFLFFVSGPSGTSRNLIGLPPGASANCPLGNEKGVTVLFTCTGSPPPEHNPATVTGCSLDRTPGGTFILTVTGVNIKPEARITINGGTARKVRFKQLDVGSNTFRSVELKGRVCSLLPGLIVITNPGDDPSQPFQCNESCDQH